MCKGIEQIAIPLAILRERGADSAHESGFYCDPLVIINSVLGYLNSRRRKQWMRGYIKWRTFEHAA